MDPRADPGLGFWEWLIGGIGSVALLVVAAVLRGYDRRLEGLKAEHAHALSEVRAENVKLWEHVTKTDLRDRERWERFEGRIEAKFDGLRSLIIARLPHQAGGDD